MKKFFQTVYDISVTLGRESIDYPGDTIYQRKTLSSIADGKTFNLSSISMSCHSGTHLDAPSHLIDGGKNIGDFPVDRFILAAQVVEIQSPLAIAAGEIQHLAPSPGSGLIFKTANSRTGICKNGVFTRHYVHLSQEAARLCAEWKLSILGVDYISAEKYEEAEFTNHILLLEREIFILEGLNLEGVPPGKYTLICLPIKISGAEGAPTRAILVR